MIEDPRGPGRPGDHSPSAPGGSGSNGGQAVTTVTTPLPHCSRRVDPWTNGSGAIPAPTRRMLR
jgi:hypothetical protein